MTNSLGSKKVRPVRQPDDLSKLPLTVDEIRMKLRRRTGDRRNKIPVSGQGKSTTLRQFDIALLARIDNDDLSKFNLGKLRFGKIVLGRLIDILIRIDAGLITKSQYGVYHFHDEPVAKPVREMRISLGQGKIMQGVKVATYDKMPAFNTLFGRK